MKAQVIFASVFLAGVLSGARSASAQQDGKGVRFRTRKFQIQFRTHEFR